MWSIYRTARSAIRLGVATVILSVTIPCGAQTVNNPYPYSSNYHNYNYGLQLPPATLPNGQDEIRAADGTTCRTSMAGNDAYLDVGGVGSPDPDGELTSGALYGRLIIPLGDQPSRLDCTRLYNLEVMRLQHEIELLRAGLASGNAAIAAQDADKFAQKAWAEDGWTNEGWSKPSGVSAKSSVLPADSPTESILTGVRASTSIAPTIDSAPPATTDSSEYATYVVVPTKLKKPMLKLRVEREKRSK